MGAIDAHLLRRPAAVSDGLVFDAVRGLIDVGEAVKDLEPGLLERSPACRGA